MFNRVEIVLRNVKGVEPWKARNWVRINAGKKIIVANKREKNGELILLKHIRGRLTNRWVKLPDKMVALIKLAIFPYDL